MNHCKEPAIVQIIRNDLNLVRFDSMCVVGTANVFDLRQGDDVSYCVIMQGAAVVCRMHVEYKRAIFRGEKVLIHDPIRLSVASTLLEDTIREIRDALNLCIKHDPPYSPGYDDSLPWLWFSEHDVPIASGEIQNSSRMVELCRNFEERIENILLPTSQ